MSEFQLDGLDDSGDLYGLDFFGDIQRGVTLMGGEGINQSTREMLNRIKCMGGPVIDYCKEDYIKQSLNISVERDVCDEMLARNRCIRAKNQQGLLEIDNRFPKWIEVYEKVKLVCLLELNNQFNLSTSVSTPFNKDFVSAILHGNNGYEEQDYERAYNSIKSDVIGLINFPGSTFLRKELDGIKENNPNGSNLYKFGMIYPYDEQYARILAGDGTIEPDVSQYITGMKNAAFKYELVNTPRTISQYFVGLAELEMIPNIQTTYTTSWGNGLAIKYIKLMSKTGVAINVPLNHKIVRVSSFIKKQIEQLNTVSIYTLCHVILHNILEGAAVIKDEFKVSVLYITMCFLKEKEIIKIFFSNTRVQNNNGMFNEAINYLCIPYISAVLHTLTVDTIREIYNLLNADSEMLESGPLATVGVYLQSNDENLFLSWVSTDLLFPNQGVLYCDGLTKGIVNVGAYAYALEQIANNFGMQCITMQDIYGKYFQYQFGGLLYQKVLACHAADCEARISRRNTQI